MKAMILKKCTELSENTTPLELTEMPKPEPASGELRIKVLTCGVCHTELDEIEGRTLPPHFPIILGHQIVGTVEAKGDHADRFQIGDRVGVAWIHSACGECSFCKAGEENICEHFEATGRDAHGGYAEFTTVDENFAYKIPDNLTAAETAPLLCAGAIGYRSVRLTHLKDGQNLGLTGFGASAHLVLKLVRYKFPNTKVFVFSRSESEQNFAKELGAAWAGSIGEDAPEKLHCIIDTTPAWKPVVEALQNLTAGGRLVINAIRKENFDQDYLLKLDYPKHLWLEKNIKSVANVVRKDVQEFLTLASQIPIKPEYQEYKLEDANKALLELKTRKIRGAKVLRVSD